MTFFHTYNQSHKRGKHRNDAEAEDAGPWNANKTGAARASRIGAASLEKRVRGHARPTTAGGLKQLELPFHSPSRPMKNSPAKVVGLLVLHIRTIWAVRASLCWD